MHGRPAFPALRADGGFALLAVLWVMVGISVLALGASLAAREAMHAARNRADLAVARWRAEDCLERARAVVGAELHRARHAGPGAPEWSRLPQTLAAAPLVAGAGCDVRLRAAGAALDANQADPEILRRLFLALGSSPEAADSLADALIDWRDPDAEPRPSGAEAPWYAARGLPGPRNGPLADPRELLRVRGLDRFAGLDTLLGVEPGRVPLDHAPLAVLAALPGFTGETVGRIAELRLRGEPVGELITLEGALSPAAREALLRRFAELSGLTTPQPDAWIVESHAAVGAPPVTAVAEVRLVRAGARGAVVRRRTWVR